MIKSPLIVFNEIENDLEVATYSILKQSELERTTDIHKLMRMFKQKGYTVSPTSGAKSTPFEFDGVIYDSNELEIYKPTKEKS